MTVQETREANGVSSQSRAAGKAPGELGGADESALDLRVIVGALVVLLVMVGLFVWLVPSTIGAGTVNITIR